MNYIFRPEDVLEFQSDDVSMNVSSTEESTIPDPKSSSDSPETLNSSLEEAKKSFSMPNLTTIREEAELTSSSPKPIVNNEIVPEIRIEKDTSDNIDIDIHAYLEERRVYLENRIGLERLLKVYHLINDLEGQLEDEKVDYSDLTAILGEGNEMLIDDIIQLVVADNFF